MVSPATWGHGEVLTHCAIEGHVQVSGHAVAGVSIDVHITTRDHEDIFGLDRHLGSCKMYKGCSEPGLFFIGCITLES